MPRRPSSPPELDTPRAASTILRSVRLGDIVLSDRSFQYRGDFAVTDLVRSLAADGQETPVDLLGEPPYRVIDGFRRLTAMLELGWTHVRACVHPRLSEDEAHMMAFIKNVVRRNLSPVERAFAIRKGLQRGQSRARLVECFGLSERQIRRYERLGELEPALAELVDGGALSMAHAKALHDSARTDQLEWALRAIEERWSARQLKFHLRRLGGSWRPKRVYVRRDGDTLRVYSFTVSSRTPTLERARIAGVLRNALDFLGE